MSEWAKTGVFLGAAVVAGALAFAAQGLKRPAAAQGFERVGEAFYPEFSDPLAANSLRVVSYDEGTTLVRPFDVTFADGRWRISPYDYPVDAADRLAKTAGSVVGITRGGLVSRREADQAKYGVIDPGSEDATKLTGRGTRITLKDEQGKTLADYVVGKAVEGQSGMFYVRRPDEKETYRATLALDLSTKFPDWIKSELLELSAGDLRRIDVQDYSIDEDRMEVERRGVSLLTRDDGFGQWQLKGLDESEEQVNQAEANRLASTLDGLKIVGVRPQPAGLNPDLSVDRSAVPNQAAMQRLAQSLVSKGFLPIPDQAGNPRLYAREGQLTATTADGVAYDLYFGDTLTGSAFDLEFGEDAPAGDSRKVKEGDKPSKAQEGRYVFVAARFDPKALGEPPQPPVEPSPADAGKGEQAAAAKAEYDAAKSAYDAKVDAAKAKVAALNERFKGWYYVISTENFKELRLSRAALVEPKALAEKAPPRAPGMSPPSGRGQSDSGTTAPETSTESLAIPMPVEAPRPTAANRSEAVEAGRPE